MGGDGCLIKNTDKFIYALQSRLPQHRSSCAFCSVFAVPCLYSDAPATHPDDVPSFKKTSKHLILDSIFFIMTMLMMGCCASNQVIKLLQTDHIWNFTIAVFAISRCNLQVRLLLV